MNWGCLVLPLEGVKFSIYFYKIIDYWWAHGPLTYLINLVIIDLFLQFEEKFW